MTLRRLIPPAAALVLAAPVLLAQTPAERPTYALADTPASLQEAVRRGQLVILSMQNTLLAELRRELTKGGAAGAMKSCHLDTINAAYEVARAKGIAAGRTSDRLRNPLNAPRPWAAPIVSRYAGQRAENVQGFVVDLGDRVGLLRPIAQAPVCASCHGRDDKLDPKVRAQLTDRYPADRATGFTEGEIRGWFWVEVPKGAGGEEINEGKKSAGR